MSEKKEPIEVLLHKSSIIRSFAAEKFVFDTLRRHDWQAVQGAFYKDPETNKLREIDVAARQYWRRSPRLSSISAILHCFVECKTLEGYHIVVTSAPPLRFPPRSLSTRWISSNYSMQMKIREALRSDGLSDIQIHKIIEKAESIAYPNDVSIVKDLLIEPPPASLLASAFRETNIKTEKEPENSVLWKAGQALSSVIRSHEAEYYEKILDEMRGISSVASYMGTDVVQEALDIFHSRISFAYIYHPVVVLECALWKATRFRVVPINSFRFVQLDSGGFVELWYDVVTRNHFPDYIRELTTYYKRAYLKAGTRRLRR